MKLSRQQEIIVSKLRDMKWHCGREWLNEIKDDRARISNLNNFYMADKGFIIKGEPCKGTICGKHKCPLFKRRAEKLGQESVSTFDKAEWKERHQNLLDAKKAIEFFDNYQSV